MTLNQDSIRKVIQTLSQSLQDESSWSSPEEVHKLRTRSRRFEAAAKVAKLDRSKSGRRLLKQIARIRKKAGKVRDMDVHALSVAALTSQTQDECSIQLLEQISLRRHKAAQRLSRLTAKHHKQLHEELEQRLTRFQGDNTAQRIQPHTANIVQQLSTDLAKWPQLTTANLHDFRLKVKELRYILQLDPKSDPALLKILGDVKDAIGTWHDWSELLTIAAKVHAHSSKCPLLRAIRSTVAAKRHQALSKANELRKQHLSKNSSKQLRQTPSREVAHSLLSVAAQPSTPANL